MAGRRDRKNRNRKRRKHADPGRLLDSARESLAREDGREALDALRQARHAEGASEALAVLSFCASIQRARQLADKGMVKEADAMRARAAQHRAAIPTPPSLTAADLVRFVRHLDDVEGVRLYASHLRAGGPPAHDAERALADQLMAGRSWDCLEALDPDHPLRRDAGEVAPSVEAMDAGDWERAASLLTGISRRSPFAPWRWFCKAMVRFVAGDDRGLLRSIERLPSDFILARTVAEWKTLCAAESAVEGAPARAAAKAGERASAVRTALGTEGGEVASLVDAFRSAIAKGRTRDIERTLVRLADALYPDDPLLARMDLLQIVNLAGLRYRLPASAITELPLRLLPAGRVAGLAARFDLVCQRVLSGHWDPAPAVAYLGRLRTEFPRARDRALARGRVLESLARTGYERVDPDFLPTEMYDALEALLERPIEDPETLFADLMIASLAADPDHREGYRFLLELLRMRRGAKPRLRSILEDMAARFPEDPDPWLELATLHYSRNAYRQGEGALAEARERAPHDERILDLQAVGFLKSADQSRRKGRFALAAQDLERADARTRPLLEIVLPVKRLLLDLVSGSDGARGVREVVDSRLAHLPPATQLRTLAVLRKDLEANRHLRNFPPGLGEAVAELLAAKAPLAEGLDPGLVVELLAPLPDTFLVLWDDSRVAPFLSPYWPALMGRTDGDRLLAVFDLLLDCEGRAAVRGEIDRRLQGVERSRRDPLLLFYLAVIRHQEGLDRGLRRLLEIVEAASPTELERLRAAAARLARHAHGGLRRALQEFDFESPGDYLSPFEDELPPLGDIDPAFDDLDSPLHDVGAPLDDETLREMLKLAEELARRQPEPREEAGGDGRRRGRRGRRGGRSRADTGYDERDGDAGDPAGSREEDAPPFAMLLEKILSPGGERDAARPAGSSQGALFDDADIAAELHGLERSLDRNGLRGMPPSLIEEVVEAAETRDALRDELGRLARECDAAGLRDGLSPEARALLFPGDHGPGHR